MTLYEARKGGTYCVEGLCVEPSVTRRLQALGLNDGTIVNVLNRKRHGALIVQVRGTRLALGKHISSSIQVSEGDSGAFRPEGGEESDCERGIHGIRAVCNLPSAEETGADNRPFAEGADAGCTAPAGARGDTAQREDESRES